MGVQPSIKKAIYFERENLWVQVKITIKEVTHKILKLPLLSSVSTWRPPPWTVSRMTVSNSKISVKLTFLYACHNFWLSYWINSLCQRQHWKLSIVGYHKSCRYWGSYEVPPSKTKEQTIQRATFVNSPFLLCSFWWTVSEMTVTCLTVFIV